MWTGDYGFVLQNLVFKDFKIRYRNMSLGVFWSLLNPLIMMAVLTFIFTRVFPSKQTAFPVFVLCGLIPFNFFSLAWSSGTNCLVDNALLIKRVSLPRVIVPIASVLSQCTHLVIQIGALLTFTLAFGFAVNIYWTLLPVVWFFEIVFVLGLVMGCAALDVYVRDMRYVVESANLILFWLVPIFYSFEVIPARFHFLYHYNPVAALVLALRKILMEASAPPFSLMWKLAVSSMLVFAAGWYVFRRLENRFFEHL